MPNKEPATEGAMADISPWDAHQAHKDLSWKREARGAALARQVAKAVVREMMKANVQYQAMMNEMHTTTIPTTLEVTSGVNGFKVMDAFDWTKNRDIYQHWQPWSEKG